MADINKITLPNGDAYTFEDENGRQKTADLITVSDSAPSSPDNKLWIKTSGSRGVLVPTVEEALALGIEGASVGQIPKIASVGNSGEPTAWTVTNYNPDTKTSDMVKPVGVDANGKLWTEISDPATIASATEDWLDENVAQETGYVIDNSLTISGAAADAKKVGDEVGELKSALSKSVMYPIPLAWKTGGISSSDGSETTVSTRIHSFDQLGVRITTVQSGYKYSIAAWNDAEYIGMWDGTSFITSVTWFTGEIVLPEMPGYAYSIVLAKSNDSDISVSDGTNLDATGVYNTKERIDEINSVTPYALGNRNLDWSSGGLYSEDGTNYATTTRIRTSTYIDKNIVCVESKPGTKYTIYAYNGSGYQGIWNGETISKQPVSLTGMCYLNQLSDYDLKIVVAKNDDSTITTDYSSNIYLYSTNTYKARRSLTNADNLNNIKISGIYRCMTNSLPTNCPVSSGGELCVNAIDSICVQTYYTTTEQHVRFCGSSGVWSNWVKWANDSISFVERATLTNSDDLNSVVQIGTYVWSGSSVPDHAPELAGGIMAVITNGSVIEQLAFNSSTEYHRYRSGTGVWSSWRNYAEKSDLSICATLSNEASSQIQQGTNYNSLTTPGNYYVYSSADAASMFNCPLTIAHRLFVITTTSSERIVQICIGNSTDVPVLNRYYNGSTWSAWNGLVSTNNVPVMASVEHLTILNNGTDYNDITEIGSYQVNSIAKAKTMLHCPTTDGHRLYVSRIHNMSSFIYQTVIAADDRMSQYVRCKNIVKNTPWTEWYGDNVSSVSNYLPIYNEFSNPYSSDVQNVSNNGRALAATLPYEQGVANETVYYGLEDIVPSVIYSSVWRDGLDVFRNLTLETFYSALANPASVLYTKTYTDKHLYNAHSWYGGVCSTYMTQTIGFRQFHTTAQLDAYLTPKTINKITDITVGDLLRTSGHIAVITQVYMDTYGAVSGFAVSEETLPCFKTTIVSKGDFESYLIKNDYTVCTTSEQVTSTGIPYNGFNPNVIYEKGNNTYVTDSELQSDGAWFYVPNSDKVLISKDGGDYETVMLANLPSKTVNNVTVYNLVSAFDGVGDYSIKTKASELNDAFIKVIHIGNVSLSGTTLSLSEWSNCVPYNYYIVFERPAQSGDDTCMEPTSGYTCEYSGNAGDIDVVEGASSVTIEIPTEYVSDYTRYKVWIEYDTGCGYKQVFSNLIT